MEKPLLLRLLLISLMLLAAASTGWAAETKPSIQINNGLISADVNDQTLQAVLNEVKAQSTIKIHFYDKTAMDRRIRVRFQNLKLEEGLKRILNDNYVFSFVRDSANGSVLSEVSIGDKSLAPVKIARSVTIPYGEGPKSLGVVTEGAAMGPSSFAVDANGNYYVCDTVNRRIQVYSADGAYLSTIALLGEAPEDITLDASGSLYVYDMNGKLYQYSPQGEPIGELSMDETRWHSRGPMRVVGDEIYARVNGVGDMLIATIDNGKISLPPKDASLNTEEIVERGSVGATSGNRYAVTLNEQERGAQINIIGNTQTASTYIPLQGIVSVEFLGEDRYGNFYAKTEADQNGSLTVEVSKFDANGTYSGSVPVPGSDYAFWSIRTLNVNEEGTIHHMMPGTDNVTLNSLNFNNK